MTRGHPEMRRAACQQPTAETKTHGWIVGGERAASNDEEKQAETEATLRELAQPAGYVVWVVPTRTGQEYLLYARFPKAWRPAFQRHRRLDQAISAVRQAAAEGARRAGRAR